MASPLRPALAFAAVLAASSGLASPARAGGDPVAGATAFRACLSCHALEPGRHMTGPSLAGLYGARAGRSEGFDRYSPALAGAQFEWTDKHLDRWLANPGQMLPGSRMTYLVADPKVRSDLIAYLKALHDGATEGLAIPRTPVLDLKTLGRASRVEAIRLCGATFHVTLKNGVSLPIWERNLRLRIDGSAEGPAPNEPAMLPGGMQGDRYTLVFHAPSEIGTLIRTECGRAEGAP